MIRRILEELAFRAWRKRQIRAQFNYWQMITYWRHLDTLWPMKHRKSVLKPLRLAR